MEAYIITIIVICVILAILLLITLCSLRVVQQTTVMIVERFGSYNRTLKPGLHIIYPFIESSRKVNWRYMNATSDGMQVVHMITDRIDMREHLIDFGKQVVITRDNVLIQIDALVYFRITDPRAATFNVSNLPDAVELLTQATLRNIIAKITLDDTFSSRDSINEELLNRIQLDAERWGVTITRVEIQNILPPDDIKQVMESQIRSERMRRAQVLRADGERIKDVINSRAEVAKRVLNAEGIRASSITLAQGTAKSKLLLAESEKKCMEVQAQSLEQSGICVTDYMVAQQYLQALGTILNNKQDSVVYLLPSSTLHDIGSIVEQTYVDTH